VAAKPFGVVESRSLCYANTYVERAAPASSITAGEPTATSEATLPSASTSTPEGSLKPRRLVLWRSSGPRAPGRQVPRIAEVLFGLYLAEREKDGTPQRVFLDFDSTYDPTHGEQEGSFYHGYYGQHIYHPLLVFDGESGHLITALLRAGNTHASNSSVAILKRIVSRLRERWPEVEIELRADAGFAVPALYGFYARRGEGENWIKDFKLHVKADRLSYHRFIANQFRLLLHACAYWLMDALRRKLVRGGAQRMQLDSLRLRLIKIGGRIKELLTKVRLHLASGHPGQDLWRVLSGAFGAVHE
jgi:hypothetical protein